MRFLMIVLVALFAYATEIKGAFGINLGEKANLEKLEVLSIKGNTLKIKPPIPVTAFAYYYVKITPISKLIYEIEALRIYTNADKCNKRVQEIKVILEDKYGKFTSDIFAVHPTFTFEKNNKKIILECNDNDVDTATLSIRYIDETLKEKAKKEELILKSKSLQEAL